MIEFGNGHYIDYDDIVIFLVFGSLLLLAIVMIPIAIKKDLKERKKQKDELYNLSEDEIEVYEKARVTGKDTYIQNEGSDQYFPGHSIIYLILMETKEGETLKFKVTQEMFEGIKEGDIGTVTVKNGEFYSFELG